MPASTRAPTRASTRSSVSERRRVAASHPREPETRDARSVLISAQGRVESHQTWYAVERPSIKLPSDPSGS